jgi:YHS domain-containing protein
MKMNHVVLCALLSLPLVACQKKEAAATATPTATAVADDSSVPKLAVGAAAKCPVTGEDFTVKESTVQVTYNGKRYAFCCADCQPTFAKNPTKYAKN